MIVRPRLTTIERFADWLTGGALTRDRAELNAAVTRCAQYGARLNEHRPPRPGGAFPMPPDLTEPAAESDSLTRLAADLADHGLVEYAERLASLAGEPSPSQPRGAFLEVIERRDGGPDDAILPNEVRINGIPLFTAFGDDIVVEEVRAPVCENFVRATLTLICRRVVIEHRAVADV